MDILYFEPTDEVTKAIERIKSSTDKDVAVVLPSGSLILQSLVNLKLLARATAGVQKELNIVTTDKIGRNLALQVGIPVYGRVENGSPTGKMLAKTPQPVTPQALRDQLQRETEELMTVTGIQVQRYDQDRLGQPRSGLPEAQLAEPRLTEQAAPASPTTLPSRERPAVKPKWRLVAPRWLKRLLFWLVIVAAAGAAAALYWFYPRNHITLTLEGEDHQTELVVTADASEQVGRDLTLLVTTVEKTGEKTAAATGTKDVGQKATGSATLVNQYSTSTQTVPAGTILTAESGGRFITTTGAVIPGAEISVEGSTTTLNKSGRVSVAIVAENAGAQYNLTSGRLKIEGITDAKEGKVFGENPSTTGGTSETRPVLQTADIDNAKNALLDELTNQATEEQLNQLTAGDIIDEATATKLVNFSSNANAGDERSEVTVTVTAAVSLLAIDQAQLRQVVEQSVNEQLDADKQFTVADNGLTYTLHSLNVAAGRLQLRVTGSGTIAARVDKEQLLGELRGIGRGRAEQRLRQVPFFKGVSFEQDPPWLWRRLAPAAGATTLTIEYAK